ncbi:MAG: hypothetical protein Q7W16_06765 [Coriobacteriia bacterium]|nr:hypothetical protein [Coriobacteriia bacterium]
MDAVQHEANTARIKEWFAANGDSEMSVTVHTGQNSVPIAAGRFLGLEEHPVSKGVYRAQFADSRRFSLNPDEEKFISIGWELEGVQADGGRLVLDKGSQRVEIVVLAAPLETPRAEDVTWPAPAAPAPPAPTPVAIAPPAAPPVAQPPAPPVAPAPPSDVVELRVRAPLYGNSIGTGFFGQVTVRFEQDWMSITGMRAPDRNYLIVAGSLVIAMGVVGLILGFMIAGDASGNSDMGAAFCFMGFGLLTLLIGLAMFFIGRSRTIRSGQMSTLQLKLHEVAGRKKVIHDTNLGCLLMLVATPVIGLIIMLALGKKVVHLNVPNDRGVKPPRQELILKTFTTADGAILERALRS